MVAEDEDQEQDEQNMTAKTWPIEAFTRLAPTVQQPYLEETDNFTLVLDLDETLGHFDEALHTAAEDKVINKFRAKNGRDPTEEEHLQIQPDIVFRERPCVKEFLKTMSQFYEIVVFTAAE